MTIITAEEVKTRLDAGEKLNLVDVREPAENAEFNIGGTLVPLGKIQTMQTDDIDDLKNEEVICTQACLMLETFGFTNVKNLAGGMMGWKQKIGG
jgi:rhodanese-related sulfurtransferase